MHSRTWRLPRRRRAETRAALEAELAKWGLGMSA